MKADIQRFEQDGRRLVYNGKTKVAKVWAEDMASARAFFMKHMDSGKIGTVSGIAVTLSYAPEVTFIIRGKELYPFVSSQMNERASYRRSTALGGQTAPTKAHTGPSGPSFTDMVEKQEKTVSEEWVELVVYCPGTQRFLFEITRGKSGFPIAQVTENDARETSIARLSDISGAVVTTKHVKPFNEVAADGVKHHFFFMICAHEFIPKQMTMKWAPHRIENKNFITALIFEKDPTVKQIVESETKTQKMDFSKIVDDIMD